MTNRAAYSLAQKIVAALEPFCEAIEIAGSIRRACPEVNDIDLVVLPKPGQEAALRARIKQRSRTISEGDQALIVELANGIQLDTWFARGRDSDLLQAQPGNWGTLLLCRTGSKEHNIKLAQRAQSMGLHWNPHHGLFSGDTLLASETEEEIFKALGMVFVPPALR